MKVVGLGEAKQGLSSYVDVAQRERVLITRHGKPSALVIGVEGLDLERLFDEDVAHRREPDPEFWAMIEQRRRGPTVSFDQAIAELGVKPPPARQTSGGGR